MRMNKVAGICILLLVGILCIPPIQTNAKTVVEKRLEAVAKEYPDQSVMNDMIWVNGTGGGGCNALIMYATLKIFHNAYVPSADTYSQIGKTTSTSRTADMQKLFKKAKVGDVIRWRSGYTDRHFALYLSGNANGVYVYECNFKTKNKVWYKHFWAWNNMKTWPSGGADKVNVYRSTNYKKVNKKKAACNYKKGDEFEIAGCRYCVTQAGVISGKVRFVGYVDAEQEEPIPKYLYINRDVTETVNCNDESGGGSNAKCALDAQYLYKVER